MGATEGGRRKRGRGGRRTDWKGGRGWGNCKRGREKWAPRKLTMAKTRTGPLFRKGWSSKEIEATSESGVPELPWVASWGVLRGARIFNVGIVDWRVLYRLFDWRHAVSTLHLASD